MVLAAGGVSAAAALVVGGQAWHAEEHPLRAAADRGAAATLQLRLTGDPVLLRSPGYADRAGGGERVVVRAELEGATVGGRSWRSGGRVVVLAPAKRWLDLLPGQRLRAEGLLLPPSRPDFTVAVLRVRGTPHQVSPPSRVQAVAGALREGLRTAAGHLPDEPAGLLPAMAVGDTSRMLPSVEEDFRAAGLTHLTAVSGTNVVIICGAALGLLRLAGAGPRTAGLVTGLVLIGFVVLARPSPSVLRAGVMGGVTLLALVLGRQRSVVPALAAAVIGLLLIDPELGGDPGFALSVLATAALVLVAPTWAAGLRERRVPAGIAEALAVPAAAHLATAPVIAGLSGEVSLVAVLANLLAVPAVAPATVLGAITAVAAPVHPGLAELLARLAGPPLGWLVGVARHAAAVPDGVLSWPSGTTGGLLLAGVSVLAVLALRLRRLRALAAAGAVGALVVLAPTRVVTPGWPSEGWAVVACDVGQGDALVLDTQTPGRAVLVDTGPDPGPVSDCLDRLGVRSLAMVVLSHLHADHVGGLSAVLADRPVAAVAIGPGRRPEWAFEEVRRQTARAGVPLVALEAGRRLDWPGLTLQVLAPLHPPSREDEGSAVNNASVVLRAVTPAGSALLTGDVELSAQADLLASGADLRADVLKVPHHGSRYTTPQFLAAVRPRVALVSVGAGNSYGHPNPGLLDALARSGTAVLRTDRGGDLAVTRGGDGPGMVARGEPRPPP